MKLRHLFRWARQNVPIVEFYVRSKLGEAMEFVDLNVHGRMDRMGRKLGELSREQADKWAEERKKR